MEYVSYLAISTPYWDPRGALPQDPLGVVSQVIYWEVYVVYEALSLRSVLYDVLRFQKLKARRSE